MLTWVSAALFPRPMWLPVMSEHRGRFARLVHGGRYICRRLAGEDSTFDVVNTRSKGWCAVVVQARYAISLWQQPGSGQAHVWKSGSSNLWQAHSFAKAWRLWRRASC